MERSKIIKASIKLVEALKLEKVLTATDLQRLNFWAAIAQLKDPYRTIVRQIYLDEKQPDEIATELGISAVEISQYATEGLKQLEKALIRKQFGAVSSSDKTSTNTFDIARLSDIQLNRAISLLSGVEREVTILRHQNHLLPADISDWLALELPYVETLLKTVERSIRAIVSSSTSRFKPDCRKNPYKILRPYRDANGLHLPPHRGQCPQCNVVFGSKRQRLFCSAACQAIANSHNRSGRIGWTELEKTLLKSFIGNTPYVEIPDAYRAAAQREGYPYRTDNAIFVRIKRMARSAKTTDDNWTMRELARQLDIPVDKVRVWVKRGLPVHRASNHLAISRQDLQAFAEQNPHRFAGISEPRLHHILRNADLVTRCLEQQPAVKVRQVQHKTTKQIFPSMRAAERALGIDRATLQRQLEDPHGWLRQLSVTLVNGEQIRDSQARHLNIAERDLKYGRQYRAQKRLVNQAIASTDENLQ